MKKCPRCGSMSFYVSAHVVQDWKVNEHGDFIEVVDECVEVIHQPNDDDIWYCANCYYEAPGEQFNVKL